MKSTTLSADPTIDFDKGRKWACIPARAMFDPRLTPVLLRTLLALGLHTDKKGRCHVKVATLAAVLGTADRNVTRYLRQLEQFGYLKIIPRYWPHGGRRENTYELVLGVVVEPTTRVVVEANHPHKERVLERGTTPALTGPGSEETMWEIDLRETEGASATMPERPAKKSPTRPRTKGHPDKLNPVSLSQYFVNKARSHQWGHPNATPVKVLAGTFRRWRDDDGVTYREIAVAIDLFFDQLPPGLEAPAGKLFIKQGYQWITEAKGDIYERDLPKAKAASKELHRELRQTYEQWLAQHPEADQDMADRKYSEIWQDLKTKPEYAIAYA